MDAWTSHSDGIWDSQFLGRHAKGNRSWFIGTNIPGRPPKLLFYFGGIPSWRSWLDKELETTWASMNFGSHSTLGTTNGDVTVGGVSITASELESVIVPLQSDQAGMSPKEKFNKGSAICARYIDWAIKDIHDQGLAVKQDHRAHWWKALLQFAHPASGKALTEQIPNTKEQLQ